MEHHVYIWEVETQAAVTPVKYKRDSQHIAGTYEGEISKWSFSNPTQNLISKVTQSTLLCTIPLS